MKGSRIHGIVREMNNENIDVINYTSNTRLFIQRALSPAEVISITLNEEEKKAENVFEIEVEEKLPTRNIILIYDTEYPQSIASKEFQKFLSSQKN